VAEYSGFGKQERGRKQTMNPGEKDLRTYADQLASSGDHEGEMNYDSPTRQERRKECLSRRPWNPAGRKRR